VDLKTAADASPHAFMRSVAKFGYDLSPFLYTQGVSEELGCSVSFYWVVVSTDDMQNVRVYKASDEMMSSSRLKCLDGIQAIKEFASMGVESASELHDHTEIELLHPPKWESGDESDLPGSNIKFPV